MNVNIKYFHVTVIAQKGNHRSYDEDIILTWCDLPFMIRVKYDWYFKYRAALLQVQHPRWQIQIKSSSEPAKDGALIRKNHFKNTISAKKRKITELNNEMRKLKENWNELFPIEEHVKYLPTVNKIKELECELRQIQVSFSTEFPN